jgi:phosphoribosylformimino-5-aminoimidazole carboxamide ribotide isomerase
LALGVRRLLVLDLARVGVARGPGTEGLCARLAGQPGVEVSAGGGVRGRADLERLAGCGVRAALVASALHDGALSRADLEGLALKSEDGFSIRPDGLQNRPTSPAQRRWTDYSP